jgi:ubiquinone/menaquinone biosynthesis C-methylase UbiE
MAEYDDMDRLVEPKRRSQTEIAFHHDTGELASTYDKTSVHQLEHGKRLISALNVASGDCLLDIGAGTGLLAAHAAEIVGPSGFVVAMDPLPLRVEIAQSKAAGNVEACVGRAEDLSQFTDESFNVVYLNSVFHWVEDKPRAIAEIFRVLTPDGRIGLTCPDPTRPHEAFQFIRRALTEVGAKHNRPIARLDLPTDYELERLMVAAGFVAYECDYWTFANVYPDVDTLLASIESASFGNFLVNSPDSLRARLRDALDRSLEPKRLDDHSIRLERYLLFATARKPKAI